MAKPQKHCYSADMILNTHAIVGGAIASILTTHPYLAVASAFASHFVIDAIPHWDYPLQSISVVPGHRNSLLISKPLLIDLGLIALDACAGLLIALALFAQGSTVLLVTACAVAAMMPDPLQFVHSRYPQEPLKTLQRFHRWAHSKRRLKWRLGVPSQLAFSAVVILGTLALHALGA
jgi:hypothetical protein